MKTHEKYKKYISDQRAFFDRLITHDLDSYNDRMWDYSRRFEVHKILSIAKPKTVLNIGSGCGFHDSIFSASEDIQHILSMDYSEKSIEHSNKIHASPKISRVIFDILSDDIDSLGKFDLVTSFQVIEHIEDYNLFMKKSCALLNPGGRLAIATPNYDRFQNRILSFFGKKKQLCDPMHFKEFTINELLALGEKNTLRHLKTFGYGFSFNIKYHFDNFLPKKILFYLGRVFKKHSNILIVIFEKRSIG